MKKKFLLGAAFIIILFGFCGCTSTETEQTTTENNSYVFYLSDYQLPENFAMTIYVSDSQIFNPGLPWYFKTAKIGNDWEIILYDRDLTDLSEQETHFYEYISDNLYQDYKYDYVTDSWITLETVSFDTMVHFSLNNFTFLTTDPTDGNTGALRTDVEYDCDPTSYVNNISAIRYTYSKVLDYEITVDATYPNIILSDVTYADRTLVRRAYHYSTTITSWDMFYMESLNYKAK